MVTIALAKGRLADESITLFEEMSLECAELRNPGRQLVIKDRVNQLAYVLVKPSDVPTYVDRGIADIGITGKDSLMEANRPLYEVLDLAFGKCKLCVAGFSQERKAKMISANQRVATKYPNITREYYMSQNKSVDIIVLNGSVELAPILNLSDVIVDIVESGATLKANGLVVLHDICDITARLVVNRIAFKTKHHDINSLIGKVKDTLTKREGKAV